MLIQRATVCDRDASHVKGYFAVGNTSEAIGSQVMRALLRNNNEVCMRNAVSVDEVADAFQWKNLTHAAADPLGESHDALGNWIGHVGEVIAVRVGDHKALARRGRLECHEGRDHRVVVDEAGGSSTGHDVAENTGHCLFTNARQLS